MFKENMLQTNFAIFFWQKSTYHQVMTSITTQSTLFNSIFAVDMK